MAMYFIEMKRTTLEAPGWRRIAAPRAAFAAMPERRCMPGSRVAIGATEPGTSRRGMISWPSREAGIHTAWRWLRSKLVAERDAHNIEVCRF